MDISTPQLYAADPAAYIGYGRREDGPGAWVMPCTDSGEPTGPEGIYSDVVTAEIAARAFGRAFGIPAQFCDAIGPVTT